MFIQCNAKQPGKMQLQARRPISANNFSTNFSEPALEAVFFPAGARKQCRATSAGGLQYEFFRNKTCFLIVYPLKLIRNNS
jgi:hypothetical protein